VRRAMRCLAILLLCLGAAVAVAQETQQGTAQGTQKESSAQQETQGQQAPDQAPAIAPPESTDATPAPATGDAAPAAGTPAPATGETPTATAQPSPAVSPSTSATTAAFGRPRFMIYLFEAEQDTLSAEEKFVLYNSILASATEANPDVVLLESPDPTVPTTQQGKEELARRINADCWLSVSASGGFANLTIQVATFDILRQETFGQELIRPGFVVDFRTISRGFWDKMAAAIKASYSRIVDLSVLTVHGRPGTQLTGVPGGPYRIDASGTFAQKIPYPSSFTMKARADGYYDTEQSLFLGIDPLEIPLNQVAKPRFGVEVRLSSFQFPGAEFWWYILPAQVFARLGFTTELLGIYPIDNAPNVLAVGSPLSQLELDAGLFISPAEDLLRFYVAAGGYLRFSHPPAPSFSVDTVGAPGALTLSLGMEYSPSRRLRFVVEYQPAFILASNPQQFINLSFVSNSFPSGQVPGYLILPWGLFDFRNLYLGLRLDL
jgi:hypothetical protein